MNRFLPSKKLSVFLGVVLVILGCFVLFYKFKNNKVTYFLSNENKEEIIKMVSEINQQTLKNDSDGDGLKDWEEILWKTDPQNSDTDGDGTDDNTEILAKRNPLIAGPNDLLGEDITTSTDAHNNSEYDKSLTQTDILSRELFTGYVALKQNSQLGTEQEDQFIDNLVVRNLSSTKVDPVKKYKLSDLIVTQNANREELLQYVNEFVTVVNFGHYWIDNLILIETALKTKDQQDLVKLNLNIEITEKMLAGFLIMKVPDVVANIHLDGINNLVNLIKDSSDMISIFEDPIRGIMGIKNYSDTITKSNEIALKITNYFKENNLPLNL